MNGMKQLIREIFNQNNYLPLIRSRHTRPATYAQPTILGQNGGRGQLPADGLPRALHMPREEESAFLMWRYPTQPCINFTHVII